MVPLLRKYMKRLIRTDLMRSEEGNMLMMVGLVAFLLIMAVGVAVDMARAQILQQRMSASLDAAGLAAAETISVPPSSVCTVTPGDLSCNTTWANQEAARYFGANFPAGYLASTVGSPTVTLPNNDLNTLNLTVSGTQQPVFMQTFGVNSLSVAANSQITRSSNGIGLEVVMALDNTGSMACDPSGNNCTSGPNSKIAGLVSAADDLVTIVLGPAGTAPPPNTWIGIVPFTQSVNIGTGSNLTLVSSARDTTFNGTLPYDSTNSAGQWSGCVTARSQSTVDASNGLTYDISDIPPTTGATLFQNYYYAAAKYQAGGYTPSKTTTLDVAATGNLTCSADPLQKCYYNQWRTSATTYDYGSDSLGGAFYTNMGPNISCPQAMTPMTASQSNLLSAIGTMTAQGDTAIDLGLAWAWRMISPRWDGVWTGSEMVSNSLPLPYTQPQSVKVVILMTDGTNLITGGAYSAYGFYNSGSLGAGYIGAAYGTTPCPDAGADDPGDGSCMQAAALDVDARTRQVCDAIKASSTNVVLYTIGFGTASSGTPSFYDRSQNQTLVDTDLLTYCAGGSSEGLSGQYFPAPTNAALKSAFQAIGNALENIRVSK